jgi:hypothetical protein
MHCHCLRLRTAVPLLAAVLTTLPGGPAMAQDAGPSYPGWDTYSDTWVATDALDRALPTAAEVGPPRPDRFVGIFYFLWLGAHVNGGPWDVTRILAQDPDAMQKPDSPLWGPMYAPHHWGESIFGYYLNDDEYVLRKHAQMLSDAGVDTLIFDVTNQFTYKQHYMPLLKVFSEIRAAGGKTPQVAFLCPFWDPSKVVNELYRDLYGAGIHPDLWFRWEGKPLIMADPARLGQTIGTSQGPNPVPLEPGHTMAQSFTVDQPFEAVEAPFPTWRETKSAATVTLYQGGPDGKVIATRRIDPVGDCQSTGLRFNTPLPPGDYTFELSDPTGKVGWWSHDADAFPAGQARLDGVAVPGDRTFSVTIADEQARKILDFFTFRKPQADYFQGPTGPDQWSWLEVAPQHVFLNSRGRREQMSVGVGQNAVGGRLGSMSEADSLGRSYTTRGYAKDPGAVGHGYNFAEQWANALREDPEFIFVTGWNEWFAGRFNEFCGVREPVMFVDEFDQEHSRDIEPMKGGHGDNYYYQLASYIRRFKGARPLPPASAPRTISVQGSFAQWATVAPEYRDDIGDPSRRNHPGYNNCAVYTNDTGRNDIISARVARDADNVYFQVRTRDPLTPATDPDWMLLYIDVDGDHATGWEGYDFVLNRTGRDATTTLLEANAGGWNWTPVAQVAYRVEGDQLMVSVPRAALGLTDPAAPLRLDFKWADNAGCTGDIAAFTLNGDVAPTGRFNYRYAAD